MLSYFKYLTKGFTFRMIDELHYLKVIKNARTKTFEFLCGQYNKTNNKEI